MRGARSGQCQYIRWSRRYNSTGIEGVLSFVVSDGGYMGGRYSWVMLDGIGAEVDDCQTDINGIFSRNLKMVIPRDDRGDDVLGLSRLHILCVDQLDKST